MSKLEKKIKELETRIQQLEARPLPMYIPVYWPYYTQPATPWYPSWTYTATTGSAGTVFVGGSTTSAIGGSNAL